MDLSPSPGLVFAPPTRRWPGWLRLLGAAWLLGACLSFGTGCSRDIWVAELVEVAAGTDDAIDANDAEDAAAPEPIASGSPGPGVPLEAGDPSAQSLCLDPSAPLLPPDGNSTICAEPLAARHFRHALCVCGTASLSRLSTDAFDSRAPQSGFLDWGASVGVNGGLPTGLFTGRIGGSLIARNSWPLYMGSSLHVTGDLMLQGVLTLASQLHVGRDAWLRGWVTGAGSLTVQRDLHIWSEGFNLGILPWLPPQMVGGELIEHDFDLPLPCDCGSERLDIAALTGRAAQLALSHPDAAAADDWSFLPGPGTLEVPCGAYYLSSVSVGGDLTIHVSGRSALFIAGDLRVGGTLAIELQPEAALDLVVGGDLSPGRLGQFGDTSRPRALRVYVGGSAPLRTTSEMAFGAALYAPGAEVHVASSTELHGALFVGRLIGDEPLQLHYDLGLSVDTPHCGDGNACHGCEECGGLACQAATCRACEQDADCCLPWVCEAGRCAPIGAEP